MYKIYINGLLKLKNMDYFFLHLCIHELLCMVSILHILYDIFLKIEHRCKNIVRKTLNIFLMGF
jgi:hypothetical protein